MNITTSLVVLLLALIPLPLLPVLHRESLRAPFLKIQIALGAMWIAWAVFAAMLGLISPPLLYGMAFLVSIAFVFFCYSRCTRCVGAVNGIIVTSYS